jgi:hypothetical protein
MENTKTLLMHEGQPPAMSDDIDTIMADLYAVPSKRPLDGYFYGTKAEFERIKQAVVRHETQKVPARDKARQKSPHLTPMLE